MCNSGMDSKRQSFKNEKSEKDWVCLFNNNALLILGSQSW